MQARCVHKVVLEAAVGSAAGPSAARDAAGASGASLPADQSNAAGVAGRAGARKRHHAARRTSGGPGHAPPAVAAGTGLRGSPHCPGQASLEDAPGSCSRCAARDGKPHVQSLERALVALWLAVASEHICSADGSTSSRLEVKPVQCCAHRDRGSCTSASSTWFCAKLPDGSFVLCIHMGLNPSQSCCCELRGLGF